MLLIMTETLLHFKESVVEDQYYNHKYELYDIHMSKRDPT